MNDVQGAERSDADNCVEAYLDELVDSVGNVSDRDAEEYNAWVARMRGAVGAGFDD